MSLVDELNKLNELRFSGALSDAEFEKAKAALLDPAPAVPEPVRQQLAETRYQVELTRIDREWELERQRYLIRNGYGFRQVPTAGVGIAAAVVGGGFGTLWTIIAIAITSWAPNFGPFAIVKIVFPLFGIFFTVFGITMGVYIYRRAKLHEQRFREYEARRARVRPEDFR
jgi:hypothetical protein